MQNILLTKINLQGIFLENYEQISVPQAKMDQTRSKDIKQLQITSNTFERNVMSVELKGISAFISLEKLLKLITLSHGVQ